jgi:hypothetical protein
VLMRPARLLALAGLMKPKDLSAAMPEPCGRVDYGGVTTVQFVSHIEQRTCSYERCRRIAANPPVVRTVIDILSVDFGLYHRQRERQSIRTTSAPRCSRRPSPLVGLGMNVRLL